MMRATGEGTRERTGQQCVVLDAEYILEVRPHLVDCEARVYEALLLECEKSTRPLTVQRIAAITWLHHETVRRAVHRFEQLGLIVSHWRPSPPSPFARRTIQIIRDYAKARAMLGAQGCEPDGNGRNEGVDAIAADAPRGNTGHADRAGGGEEPCKR